MQALREVTLSTPHPTAQGPPLFWTPLCSPRMLGPSPWSIRDELRYAHLCSQTSTHRNAAIPDGLWGVWMHSDKGHPAVRSSSSVGAHSPDCRAWASEPPGWESSRCWQVAGALGASRNPQWGVIGDGGLWPAVVITEFDLGTLLRTTFKEGFQGKVRASFHKSDAGSNSRWSPKLDSTRWGAQSTLCRPDCSMQARPPGLPGPRFWEPAVGLQGAGVPWRAWGTTPSRAHTHQCSKASAATPLEEQKTKCSFFFKAKS